MEGVWSFQNKVVAQWFLLGPCSLVAKLEISTSWWGRPFHTKNRDGVAEDFENSANWAATEREPPLERNTEKHQIVSEWSISILKIECLETQFSV